MNQQYLSQPDECYHLAVSAQTPVVGALNVIGIGYDGAVSFRKGAKAGPDAIRRASHELESYSPVFDLDLEQCSPFYDLGNLTIPRGGSCDTECTAIHSRFNRVCKGIDPETDRTALLVLGGDHSISYPSIRKYLNSYPELILLHLDAHADLRASYQGNRFSHAAVIRRCLDLFGPDHRLAQFGIRSGEREEYVRMRKEKSLFPSLAEFLHFLTEIPEKQPIYLTLDLDFFDPAFMPGTGTPEPGGEDFRTLLTILSVLRQKNLVAADVVELAPLIDPTGNSSIFAAKVVRELIFTLHLRSRS